MSRVEPSAPYFFYGTLVDLELLVRVSGCPLAAITIEPATIAGYRRTGVIGRTYPILIADPISRAAGIVVRGLDGRAGRRLSDYEGSNYRLTPVTAIDSAGRPRAAIAFLFFGRLRSDRRNWQLDIWQRRWKRRAMRRAGRLQEVRRLRANAFGRLP